MCALYHEPSTLSAPITAQAHVREDGWVGWLGDDARDGSCPADEASSRFGAFKRSRALLARRTQVIGEELSRRPSSRLPVSWRCRPGTA